VEAGVQQAIVNFPGLDGPEPVRAFAEVVSGFRPR
jgi:hypothetical protein